MQNSGQHLLLLCSSTLQLGEQFFYHVVFLYNMIFAVMLDSCPMMQEMLMEEKKAFLKRG